MGATCGPLDRGGSQVRKYASAVTLRRRAGAHAVTIRRGRAVISRENSTGRGLHPAGRPGLNASMALRIARGVPGGRCSADMRPRTPAWLWHASACCCRTRSGIPASCPPNTPIALGPSRRHLQLRGTSGHYKNPTLKVYNGARHGMCAMHEGPSRLPDLLAFLEDAIAKWALSASDVPHESQK